MKEELDEAWELISDALKNGGPEAARAQLGECIKQRDRRLMKEVLGFGKNSENLRMTKLRRIKNQLEFWEKASLRAAQKEAETGVEDPYFRAVGTCASVIRGILERT